MNLEALVAGVGVVVFTLTFIAGFLMLTRRGTEP